MAGPVDRRLFEQVFSDAHVIDVDFSQWDKQVSLCVVADHVEVPTPPRLPLFLVEFLRVSKFFITFNHFEVEMEGSEKHFQWNIDEFKIRNIKNRTIISLSGGKTWPDLQIECQEIGFRQISHAVLDDIFPGWNRPYNGLARPGILALSRLFRTRMP